MLVLSRREGEKIAFPDLGILVQLLSIKGSAVRVGIDAPAAIAVLRGELLAEGQRQAARRSSDPQVADPKAFEEFAHAARNRLNAATLALHLLQRQLDAGLTDKAEQTLSRILEELQALDGKREETAPPPAISRAGRRALVVEDDASQREMLAGFLSECGFSVSTAGDGAAALDYLASHDRPDMVLLDMRMARVDGPTTLRAIRRDPRYCQLKVFAISGTPPSDWGIAVGPTGVDRWFQKPVDPERLVEEVSRAMSDSPGGRRTFA